MSRPSFLLMKSEYDSWTRECSNSIRHSVTNRIIDNDDRDNQLKVRKDSRSTPIAFLNYKVFGNA